MPGQAGSVLCHGGCHQEWRDEDYCDDVFHRFSPAFSTARVARPHFSLVCDYWMYFFVIRKRLSIKYNDNSARRALTLIKDRLSLT
jgi:hypothetical protein